MKKIIFFVLCVSIVTSSDVSKYFNFLIMLWIWLSIVFKIFNISINFKLISWVWNFSTERFSNFFTISIDDKKS